MYTYAWSLVNNYSKIARDNGLLSHLRYQYYNIFTHTFPFISLTYQAHSRTPGLAFHGQDCGAEIDARSRDPVLIQVRPQNKVNGLQIITCAAETEPSVIDPNIHAVRMFPGVTPSWRAAAAARVVLLEGVTAVLPKLQGNYVDGCAEWLLFVTCTLFMHLIKNIRILSIDWVVGSLKWFSLKCHSLRCRRLGILVSFKNIIFVSAVDELVVTWGGGCGRDAPTLGFRAPAGQRPAIGQSSIGNSQNPHRSHEICAETDKKSTSGQLGPLWPSWPARKKTGPLWLSGAPVTAKVTISDSSEYQLDHPNCQGPMNIRGPLSIRGPCSSGALPIVRDPLIIRGPLIILSNSYNHGPLWTSGTLWSSGPLKLTGALPTVKVPLNIRGSNGPFQAIGGL